MKKFFIRLSLLLIIIAIIDFCFGESMKYITEHTVAGQVGRDNYISNQVDDDILIFGSSRAADHYNAQMIMDSTGISCFNCGQGGMGVTLAYGRLLMIEKRNIPKHIILDVMPEYDYLDGEDNHRFLNYLKPHYGRPGIDSIFYIVDRTEPIKMLSGIYRYNCDCAKRVTTFLKHDTTRLGIRGFLPIQTNSSLKLTDRNAPPLYSQDNDYEYDSIKVRMLKKFILQTRGIDVTFVVSPVWYGTNSAVFDTVRTLCSENDIRFIDYSNDSKYIHNDKWFSNGTHLNAMGAGEFTRDLIKRLKEEGSLDVKRK